MSGPRLSLPLLTAAVLAATASPALAGWSPPVSLYDRGGAGVRSQPLVAMDPRGNAVTTWVDATADPASGSFLRAVGRAPVGLFGPVETVSGPPTAYRLPLVDLALNGRGEAIVTLQDTVPSGGNQDEGTEDPDISRFSAAVRPPAGPLAAPTPLSGEAEYSGIEPIVGGAGGGNTIFFSTRPGIEAVERPALGAFGPRRNVLRPGFPRQINPLALASHRDGSVTMVGYTSGRRKYVTAAVRRPGRSFGKVQILGRWSRGCDPFDSARLAVNASGDAVATRPRARRGRCLTDVLVRRRGGRFVKLRALGGSASGLNTPQVGIDSRGAPVVLYDRCGRRACSLATASGKGLRRMSTLSHRTTYDQELHVTPGGGAVAVWSEQTGRNQTRIRYALRRPGHAFARPRTLATGAERPALAVNARGDAVAVWQTGPAERSVLHAAARRAGGVFARPTVIALKGPGDAGFGSREGEFGSRSVGIDRAGNALVVWSAFATGEVAAALYRP